MMVPRVPMKKHSTVVDDLLARRNDYTPDYLELKEKHYYPVFVYGTLKAGYPLHRYMEDFPYLGRGVMADWRYELYDHGPFPVVMKGSGGKKPKDISNVLGEVYVVPTSAILDLDQVEGNNYMYIRQKKWFFLPDQKYKTKQGMVNPYVDAFVYVGNPEFWNPSDLDRVHPRKATEFGWQKKVSEWVK